MIIKNSNYIILFCISLCCFVNAQEIAVLKYSGGGDWYSNPTALPNLVQFCNDNIHTVIANEIQTVSPDAEELFNYPYVYLTGHGNIYFSESDAQNLRTYLLSGGFLHVDDNYGLKPYFEKAIKKVFPDKSLQPVPKNHPIFSQKFDFPDGLPKIHVHDGKSPELLGLFHKDRLILVFSYESDLGNGWEDSEVHNNPEEIRQKSLQMGANIIQYAFTN